MSCLRVRFGLKISLLPCLFFVFFLAPLNAFARSDYVLPYPSVMPGNKMYVLHIIEERISKYWYFGDYGSFTYNRQLADKYLVEAKTLFEYNQHLLALRSLAKSNKYFQQMLTAIESTDRSKNGREEKVALMRSAAEKHQEILEALRNELPQSVVWQEEKKDSQVLTLSKELSEAMKIRQTAL